MVVVGIFGAGGAALAEVQDRFRVAGESDGRGYPASLQVVITSPPDYVLNFAGRLGNDGHWKGPRYAATLRPSLGGESTLDWSAGVYKTPSNRRTIIDNLTHDWPGIAEGAEPIERRVGGRDVGTLQGTWVLTQAPAMAGAARYELGVVVPLCGRTALIKISALTPSGNSAGGSMGFGEYRMANGSLPTEWNRQQVMATAERLAVEGSMPAARITGARRGRRIAGRVVDCNGHASAGTRVQLERRVGRRWRVVARGTTGADGSYALRARGTGPFRAVSGSRRTHSIR